MITIPGTLTRRGRGIARGLLVLAAVLLLPLAAVLQTPQQTAAQSTEQDTLWAGHYAGRKIWVCADPSSPAALTSCFNSGIDTQGVYTKAMATDGVNVYYAGINGGLSCPIADRGANCTHIMAGGWGDSDVLSLAAADGQIWMGQENGIIYRCPANLPYAQQTTMPAQCVQLDDAWLPVQSLLLANGRLYAGLHFYTHDAYHDKQDHGSLWSCDPQKADSCNQLDNYGKTVALSLAAGGGYLWAGLENGIIWRCDLNTADKCETWEYAGKDGSVTDLSYDGQGTLYAATNEKHGVIWSCPTASANGCSNVFSNVRGYAVAAGAGSVFSSSDDGLYFGTSKFTGADAASASMLLYLPAGGPVEVGAAKVTIDTARNVGRKLAQGCRAGKNPTGTVKVSWNTEYLNQTQYYTTTFKACDLTKQGVLNWSYGFLNDGDYRVTVTVGKYCGYARYTIKDAKDPKPVDVSVKRC